MLLLRLGARGLLKCVYVMSQVSLYVLFTLFFNLFIMALCKGHKHAHKLLVNVVPDVQTWTVLADKNMLFHGLTGWFEQNKQENQMVLLSYNTSDVCVKLCGNPV